MFECQNQNVIMIKLFIPGRIFKVAHAGFLKIVLESWNHI